MTRDESLTIVGMILSRWPASKEWTKDQMSTYAQDIEDMDAEITTSAVLRAVKEVQYRPSVAELREFVRAERRRLQALVEPKQAPKGAPIPSWVRRWICARMLYSKFGKEKDMRRFAEQGDWGDLTQPLMPEGAWEEEARRLSESEVSNALRSVGAPR